MLNWWTSKRQADIAEPLHGAVVAAARRPALFATLGVPDNPWGRIESVMLHTLLLVRRLSGTAAQPVAHALVDRMFADFDRGLRQVGVGDLSVPKKMRALGGDWLARVEAYGPFLDARDAEGLAASLARNVLAAPDNPLAADPLAHHVLACEMALAAQPVDALVAGTVVLPDPGGDM